MNIKFNYLYRDGGNYKVYGSVVFANPEKIKLAEIEKWIKIKLIDGEFFDPKEFNIPRLIHEEFTFDPELDHSWNEFVGIEETSESKTDKRTISQFLKLNY